jgi:Na+/proline symporter
MSALRPLDWLVLGGTILGIVLVGLWRGRQTRTSDGYLTGGDLPWWTIGLSVMATQASAITFLSMPGQAFDDGMGFVQFYFGQPIAMVFLAAFVVPIYARKRVRTAYEWLEGRFDRRTRQLTAFLFLVQRGLAAGLSIYAPAIVLSTLLGWSLPITNVVIGLLAIGYTVSGGTRAVSRTQTLQMTVMLGGMAIAFVIIARQLPVSVGGAFRLAGVLGRMQIVDTSLRLGTRYTLWSGLLGGLFVGLAYFGTDQSQVQRYLTGSVRASRLGLLFNGVVKVPMQFLILCVGVMVFVFAQFHPEPPLPVERLAALHDGDRAAEARAFEASAARATEAHQAALADWMKQVPGAAERLADAGKERDAARAGLKKLVLEGGGGAKVNDADYVFLRFVLAHFPAGLVGLLLAVIFCAAMSATAATLNALGTTTVVDFYKRSWRPDADDEEVLRAARWLTAGWGLIAVGFAAFAQLADNLIQAVNVLGSIFYGPTLGVFLVGFFSRRVGARAVIAGLVVGQGVVFAVFAGSSIGYLWYNVIGCAVTAAIALSWPPQPQRGDA